MTDTPQDKPPLFKTWRGWYILVLGVLFIQIVLYFWLTQSFA